MKSSKLTRRSRRRGTTSLSLCWWIRGQIRRVHGHDYHGLWWNYLSQGLHRGVWGQPNLPPPPCPPQPPSTLTNVPDPSATPASAPPSTPLPPTCLALYWRRAFLLLGSAAPGFYINYAIKGDRWYGVMGGASVTTCGGTMILYYFTLMYRHDHDDITNEGGQQPPLSSFKSFLAFINRTDNLYLAIFGL